MDVPSTAAGKIVEVPLKRGDRVSKGTVIARLDTEGGETAVQPMPGAPDRSATRPESGGDTVRMPLPEFTEQQAAKSADTAKGEAAKPPPRRRRQRRSARAVGFESRSTAEQRNRSARCRIEADAASSKAPRRCHIEAATAQSPEPSQARAPSPPPAAAATGATAAGTASATPSAAQPGERKTQLLVLGAGPGGYTAAFRAADLGMQVTLVERWPSLGGVCLNVGCIPSKALLHAAKVIEEASEMGAHGIAFGEPEIDLDKLRNWKTSVVKKLTGGLKLLAKQRKVEVVRGNGEVRGPERRRSERRTERHANASASTSASSRRAPSP